MNVETLIKDAQSEGVSITSSDEGEIILTGRRKSREKWASILTRYRNEIMAWFAQAEPDPFDDRRTCAQCANLSGSRCLAAKRGEITASRSYGRDL